MTTVGTTLDKRSRLASWLKGHGIEIGALHRPLPVPPGARVTYVDRLSVDELRRHYPELADLPLTPVGVIGTAENLSAFKDSSLDFIIANHLLEHLEDPIKGLIEFHRVLKPDGALYMALPDARLTFDRERALTPPEHLIEEHRSGPAANRREHYVDWTVHVENGALNYGNEPEQRVKDLMEMGYAIHFHVWRADSFLEFFFAACKEAKLDFEVAAFAPPEQPADDEFVVVMLKGRPAKLRLPSSPVPFAAKLPDHSGLAAKAWRTLVMQGPKPLALKTTQYLRRRIGRNGS
jgi:predicted SAM-dependent methyltransferase